MIKSVGQEGERTKRPNSGTATKFACKTVSPNKQKVRARDCSNWNKAHKSNKDTEAKQLECNTLSEAPNAALDKSQNWANKSGCNSNKGSFDQQRHLSITLGVDGNMRNL